MDAHDVEQMTILFTRVANAARSDPKVAEQVRDALAASRLLEVFGSSEALDVVDLLDSSGEVALRARLGQCTLAELKQIVSSSRYDEEHMSARWRSTGKFVDLIVERTKRRLEEELANPPASTASWML